MPSTNSNVIIFPDTDPSNLATPPDSAVRDRIHSVWDTLADFDASKVDDALAFLQTKLCELVNAQNADWIGVVRMDTTFPGDPVGGWRPPVVRVLHHNEQFLTSVKEQTKNLESGLVNEVVIRMVGMSGNFRACRLCDLMSIEWFDTPFYHSYYRNSGYQDAVYVAFPVNEDAESYFGLFRTGGQPFSIEERDTLAYTLRGIKWFHKQLLLSHGLLVASTPLTPVERQVLHGLLSGCSEKEIAIAQEQSYHTTHEYVRAIYRKFGINNRAALMALWLGRAP